MTLEMVGQDQTKEPMLVLLIAGNSLPKSHFVALHQRFVQLSKHF